MNLTNEQKEFFTKLTESRQKLADALAQFAAKGIKRSITDKYSDQAHFVYELLQNADDVKASQIRFKLSKSGLICSHNGLVKFNITDPDKEGDTSNLGHINSITSIGNSSKSDHAGDKDDSDFKIGKFGVGFKSVFLYTDTPHIYDDNFWFKIERLVVPYLLKNDLNGRKKGDTVFHFPFNKSNVSPEKCFKEIFQKLAYLSNPLLFLRNLNRIEIEINDEFIGYYRKETIESNNKDDLIIEKVKLSYSDNENNDMENDYFYVFSKYIQSYNSESDSCLTCSIAYCVDEENNVLYDNKFPAYCFFATAAVTQLKFIVHAPFLLTDSREGIKDDDWNTYCIQEIAKLTVSSLQICKEEKYILINDKFFNVLPINSQDFPESNRFHPIYQEVLNELKTQPLLPVNNGETYTRLSDAYLSDSIPTRELLAQNNSQPLRDLVNNQSASWAFSTVTGNQSDLWKYVKDNLVQEEIDYIKLARRLNKEFIEKQTDDWLMDLYAFLHERQSIHPTVKVKPIFIEESSSRKAIAAFNIHAPDGKPQIYLSSSVFNSYTTIKKCFEEDEKSLAFFQAIGINYPDVHDEMSEFIKLRLSNNNGETFVNNWWQLLVTDFQKFLHYYLYRCNSEQEKSFINKIKSLKFIKPCFCLPTSADNMYYPTDHLEVFFGNLSGTDCPNIFWKKYPESKIWKYLTNPPVSVFDKDFYEDIYMNREYGESRILEFLNSLGIHHKPRILENIDYDNHQGTISELRTRFRCKPYRQEKVIDYDLDGLSRMQFLFELRNFAIQYMEENKDSKDDPEIASNFVDMERFKQEADISLKSRSIYLFKLLTPIDEKYYKGAYVRGVREYHPIDSKILWTLKNMPWLYDKNDIPCKPSEITKEELSSEYDLRNASTLIKYLELRIDGISSSFERKLRSKFPDLTEDQMISILTNATQIRETKLSPSNKPQTQSSNTEEKISVSSVLRGVSDAAKEKLDRITTTSPKQERKNSNSIDLQNRIEDKEEESDENLPISINLQKEIQKIEASAEDIIAQLTRRKQLEETVENSEKYTFAWFKALLELEYSCASEDQVKKNPLQVVFKKVEREANTDNTIILSETTSIPSRLEDVGDLQLVLNFKNNENKSVQVEAVSLQKWILKAKLKNISELDGIKLDDVESAIIEVKNADFILEKLRNNFIGLHFADEDNLQDQLPKNIEFVFGSPGTGKTTYLVKKEILDRITNPEIKILVLTPTNKAADVLTKRLMQESPSYADWLVRYGITKDSEIANSPIFKTKEIAASADSKLVLITTTARFPYDSFRIENQDGEKLKDFNWDYIIFDEASMISLASIVYTIYYVNKRKPDCKFIVGGDPFQLTPVIHVAHDGWKDGNIYTLVGLDQEDSFVTPDTKPHKYTVKNLETQYRSIEKVGKLFSEFRYKDKLKHHRLDTDINEIEVVKLPLEPVTIIDFKVSRFESVYKPRKVKGSNYQIYSAILTVELIKYILENITIQNENKYRIGVICPYRIQANIIDKLLSKLVVSSEIEIITGTVHSFQGDECEMIINLLNPPLGISESEEIFLNKKNLLNVSISRAKDYLILLMPVDKSQSIQTDKLKHINTIRTLSSSVSISYNSEEVEEIILGGTNVIEDFSFPTTHQDVNVYVEPEKKYEIRYDDNAVDIQVKLREKS
ncbi:MAG: AAA domain-containing protein [Pseudanabaena sp. ELA607]